MLYLEPAKHSSRSVTLLSALCICMAYPTSAKTNDLIVIADAGGTSVSELIPDDVLSQMNAQQKLMDINELNMEAQKQADKVMDRDLLQQKVISALFPVVSPQLKPIHLTVDIDKRNPNVPFPIGVVGSDKSSRKWLRANYEYLASIEAQIIIVEVPDLKTLNNLKRSFPKLKFTPQVGAALKQQYGIPGYPVLVTNQGIYQQ